MVPNTSVVGSVSNSGFNPKWISNLQAWYDAADSSTLYNASSGGSLVAPSGSIRRWEDKSANAWHVTNYDSGTSTQPIRVTSSFNGLDTIRFDGVDDWLIALGVGVLKNVTAATFFVVSTSENKASINDFIGIANSTNGGARMDFYTDANTGRVGINTQRLDTGDATYVIPYYSANSSGSILNCYSYSIIYNASSSYFYVSGVEQTLSGSFSRTSYSGSTSNTTCNFALGNFQTAISFLKGNMAEVIYYDKSLSNTERRAVERYLTRKWNIRSYNQKTSASTDIFSNIDVYLDANNAASNPGSGTTWTDLSGKGRNATLTNGAAFATSQSISYVSLDGTNDFVNCGTILNYTSESFSISGWYMLSTGDYTTEEMLPWFKGEINTNGYYGNIQYSAGATGRYVLFTNQSGANQASTSAVSAVYPNKWTFLTVTRSGSTVGLYINGVYATGTRASHTNPASAASNNLQLGAYATFIYNNMRIGLFIAHSKVLSNQEVLELYNFTKGKYNIID